MEFSLPKIDYIKILSDNIELAKEGKDYKNAIRNLISIRDKETSANKFIDEFLKELSNDEIYNIKFVPQTISQKISILGACLEARDWSSFDKIVDEVKKDGIKNLNIDLLIEEAEKIR